MVISGLLFFVSYLLILSYQKSWEGGKAHTKQSTRLGLYKQEQDSSQTDVFPSNTFWAQLETDISAKSRHWFLHITQFPLYSYIRDSQYWKKKKITAYFKCFQKQWNRMLANLKVPSPYLNAVCCLKTFVWFLCLFICRR